MEKKDVKKGKDDRKVYNFRDIIFIATILVLLFTIVNIPYTTSEPRILITSALATILVLIATIYATIYVFRYTHKDTHKN